ncbi:MAG: methyltransferase domain-containing protein [Deltaproteobacteria bacterium]|nr:MAG: methyltransferase domain-containing protein [Deltaproteobacteria bacterium]
MNRGTSPGGLIIRQPERGYRFSIDSVVLAGFAAPLAGGRVLDLGTGCGVLLLLLSRLSDGNFDGCGVEIQEELLSSARENFRKNGLDGTLWAVKGDFRGAVAGIEPGSFDLVVSNPPFRRAGTGRRNPDPGKEAARHEVSCSLPELFDAAARYMAPSGRFALVLPFERLPEIEACARLEGMGPELVRFVHPREGSPPSRVLCCASRRPAGTPREHPPLYLHGDRRKYCPEVDRVCALFRDS